MNRKIVNDKQYLPKSMYNRRKIPQMQNTDIIVFSHSLMGEGFMGGVYTPPLGSFLISDFVL